MRVWHVRLPDGRWCYVESYTKGEARAAAKRELGIRGRLPVGTEVGPA